MSSPSMKTPAEATPAAPERGPVATPRTPWWVYLLAASFLVAFSFDTYQTFMGYAGVGVEVTDASNDGARVEQVLPGAPMEKAGVRAGDVIVGVDGQIIRKEHDVGDPRWNYEPGKPIVFTVKRDGQQLQFTVVLPERRVWETLNRGELLDRLLYMALGVIYLGAGLVILFARPRDWGAVAGATLILVFSSVGTVVSTGCAVLFRHLPFPLQLLAFAVHTLGGGYLLLLFSALFPRPFFRRRWILPALIVPGLLLIPNNVIRMYHRLYMPGHEVFPGPAWHYQAQLLIESGYLLGALLLLALGYKRLQEARERRRMRSILYAALITFGAFIVYFWLISVAPDTPLTRLMFSRIAGLVFLLLWSVFPVWFAYSVVRSERRPSSSMAASA